jgi:hypothetical protein
MATNRKNQNLPKTRVTPSGFQHDMDPFFMGLAAAEFMPADPAAWFEAACAARMSFGRIGDKIRFPADAGANPAHDFLKGILIGTVGGVEALNAWMKLRDFAVIDDGN